MKPASTLPIRILEWIIAACLAVMVAMVFGNVVLRYVFNSGIAASEEISRLMFVWLVFLGAIVALEEHGHLGVDLLVRRLPPLGRKICFVLSHLLMLYGLWLMGAGAWQQTVVGLGSRAPVTGYPLALVNVAALVCAVAMALILFRNLVVALFGRLSDEDLVIVQESSELDEAMAAQRELAPPPRRGSAQPGEAD